jgi:sugar phosphate isomerase/epimerase
MSDPDFEIGIITDEVSRDLRESLEICAGWGLSHFELREGEKARFPGFTPEEIARVDEARKGGAVITAVSPGIFKGRIEENRRWQHEVGQVAPRAIELAQRFDCGVLIAFGFEGCDNDPANRYNVLRALERIAELADAASMRIAIENEPGYWIDRPDAAVALLREIDHPALRLNWDPANLHWGGLTPDQDAIETLMPYLLNLHVKDFSPDDEEAPWRPLGRGVVPWEDLLPGILELTTLKRGTVETHCEPLVENSAISVEYLRNLLTAC